MRRANEPTLSLSGQCSDPSDASRSLRPSSPLQRSSRLTRCGSLLWRQNDEEIAGLVGRHGTGDQRVGMYQLVAECANFATCNCCKRLRDWCFRGAYCNPNVAAAAAPAVTYAAGPAASRCHSGSDGCCSTCSGSSTSCNAATDGYASAVHAAAGGYASAVYACNRWLCLSSASLSQCIPQQCVPQQCIPQQCVPQQCVPQQCVPYVMSNCQTCYPSSCCPPCYGGNPCGCDPCGCDPGVVYDSASSAGCGCQPGLANNEGGTVYEGSEVGHHS